MSDLSFTAIPKAIADAFRNDPNKYLPEFEFHESGRNSVLWQSKRHLRADASGNFGEIAKDGNGSSILIEDENFPSRRYVIFDGNGHVHMSFVEAYAAAHNISEEEALDNAFEIYKIERNEAPEIASMRKAQSELQNEFAKITDAAQLALRDEAPSEAKAYALKRFSASEGVTAKVGYISLRVYEMIRELINSYELATGRKVGWAPNAIIGRICAPITMLGHTYGYICRLVEKPKPMDETMSETGTRAVSKYCNITFYGQGKKPVYGLVRAKKVGMLQKPNAVLVEGEFASIKIRALTGMENVFAIGQASVLNYQASMIRTAGYEIVTLFLDNDGPSRREDNLKSLEQSVLVLRAEGLRANAIRVEHDEDRKFAPDDEVMAEDGIKTIKGLIDNAQPAVFTIIGILSEIYNAGQASSSDRDREFVDECIKAIAFYSFDEIERAHVIKEFVAAIGVNYGVDEMRVKSEIARLGDKAAAVENEAEKRARLDKAARLYQSAANEMLLGYQDEAKKSVASANAILDERKLSDFLRVLPPQNPSDIFQDTRIGDPIEMPFYLTPNGKIHKDDEYEKEAYRYAITSSGVDVISALTSHGKTRMLENIALQCVYNFQKSNQEKQVLFFTAEEVRPSIMSHFISIEAGASLMRNGGRLGWCVKNPIVGIQKILATNKFDCVHDCEYNNNIRRDDAINIIASAQREVCSLIKGGRISIFRVNSISEIEHIAQASEKRMQAPVGAIFVDYAQIIQSDSKFVQDPKTRISDVMNRLLLLAQDTGAAVAVGSQMNRGKYTPLTMDCQNNALASDLEQIAYSDMLIWNSSGKLREDAVWNEGDSEVLSLKYLGFQLCAPGHLYVRLGKNRRGDRNVWGVLDFDGASGYISGNTKQSFVSKNDGKTERS